MEAVYSSLGGMIDLLDESPEAKEAIVFSAWKRVAGEAIACRTAPEHLEGKTLKVAVEDETWKRHLESLAGQLVFKLNSALRAKVVTYIRFEVREGIRRQAKEERPLHSSEGRLKSLALEQITAPLNEAALSIRDKNLRRTFLLAAGGCLLRKKMVRGDCNADVENAAGDDIPTG